MSVVRNIFDIKINNSEKRIYYLDFVRGILIFLVLYHHSSAPLNNYVLQFHMPALFVLSGYTEYVINKEKPFFIYMKSKFFRLMVPYFCFEIVNLIGFCIIEVFIRKESMSFLDAFVSIITCVNNSYIGLYGRLWFLPAMFVCSIFSYIIKNVVSKNKLSIIAVFCFIMFTLSYISCNVIPFRLPFTIDIAFLGTAFFLLGHLCGKGIKYIFEKKSLSFDFILLIISGALFVLCNRYTNPVCYMYINKYDDFPFMVVCAILGTVMSFVLAKFATRIFDKISFLRNIVMWYSVNSLAVFPVHLTIKVLSIPVLSHLGLNNWFCLLILMFGLTIPIVNIITKYFPFLLGEFNFSKFFRKNKINIVH